MQYVLGQEVAEQTIHEVRFLALSPTIPWQLLSELEGIRYFTYDSPLESCVYYLSFLH